MAEKAQAKVQVSVQRFVEEVDRGGLRRMEKEMHECAARCCAKEDLPIREVHACVEKCSDKTKRAQNLVQGELQRFQEGLSRCVAQCQDDIKDQIPAGATDADIAKFRTVFEDCAAKCCDLSVDKLPALTKKTKEKLEYGVF